MFIVEFIAFELDNIIQTTVSKYITFALLAAFTGVVCKHISTTE